MENEGIRDQNSRFETLVSFSPISVFIVDQEGRYSFVNPAACALLGYTKEELLSLSVGEVAHPDYLEAGIKSFVDLKQEGKVQSEISLRHKDGSRIEVTLDAVRLDENSFLGHCTDMTEKNRITRELNARTQQLEFAVVELGESQERFKELAYEYLTVFDGSQDSLFLVEVLGENRFSFQSTNVAHQKQTGYTSSQVRGKTPNELLGPQLGSIISANYKKCIEAKAPITIEEKSNFPSGERDWLTTLTPVFLNGVPIYIVGSSIDITEQKKSQEALKQQEEFLRSVTDSIPGIPFLLRRSVEGTYSVPWASPKLTTLSGLPLNDLFLDGKLFFSLIHPEDREYTYSQFNESTEKLLVLRCDFRLRENGAKDFSYYRCEAFPRKEKNNATIWFSYLSEIQDIKNIEQELRNAKEIAESANIAKSEFLANMSHEIRTPLNAILGFSEVLLNTIQDPASHNYLNIILKSGRTLLTLINDILDLSKIEAGLLDIQYLPVNMNRILNDLKVMFEQKVKDKKLQFILEIPSNFPATIFIDEIRLRQILINLIGNAVKYTQAGFVKVSFDYQLGGFPEKRCTLNAIVQDSGIGIDEKNLDIIFESFRQAPGVASLQLGGTGLGLAITNRLVALMKGTLSVQSKLGAGSTFTVSLPNLALTDGEEPAHESQIWDYTRVKFLKSSIFIVDDMYDNIEIVRAFLNESGLQIHHSLTGGEALRTIPEMMPDLILMDIRISDINGIEITKQLKENKKTASIPIIAFTTSSFASGNSDTLKMFDGLLHKPVTRNQITTLLLKYLPYTLLETKKADTPSNELIFTPLPDTLKNELAAAILWDERCELRFPIPSGYIDIEEIEKFSANLCIYQNKLTFPFFISFRQNLSVALDNFDVQIIQKLLARFQTFKEELISWKKIKDDQKPHSDY